MVEKCVFDISYKKCACLTEKNCYKCRFRKSATELKKGRENAAIRLINIPGGRELLEKYGTITLLSKEFCADEI